MPKYKTPAGIERDLDTPIFIVKNWRQFGIRERLAWIYGPPGVLGGVAFTSDDRGDGVRWMSWDFGFDIVFLSRDAAEKAVKADYDRTVAKLEKERTDLDASLALCRII